MMSFSVDLSSLAHTSLAPILSAVAATFILFFLYDNFKSDPYTPKGFKKIPVPGGRLPYIGHLLSLGRVHCLKLTEMQNKCGPLMRIFMGVQSWILIGDPIIAHEIFMVNGRVTSDRPFQTFSTQVYSLEQRGVVFTNANKRWTRTRNAVFNEILAPKNVERLGPSLELGADYIVKYLLETTTKDNGVRLIKPLKFAAMSVIANATIGTNFSSPEDPLFEDILETINTIMKLGGVTEDLGGFLPILSYLNVFYRKERCMKTFIDKLRDPLFKRVIKQAIKGDTDCFARTLYTRRDEFKFDDDDIMITIGDLLTGGTEPVAITIAWCIVILCCHPEVQKKLRDEVDAFIKVHNRLPTFNERESFPLLISVLKECIRYRPTSSFGVLHKSTEDFEVRGYFIPKDTVLVSNMYAMHWNSERYSEPEKFIPERFMDNIATFYAASNSRIENRDIYNFGWGRRLCPGSYLAEAQMFNIMIRLMAKSEILPVLDAKGNPVYPDLDKTHNSGLNSHPDDDNVRIVARVDALI